MGFFPAIDKMWPSLSLFMIIIINFIYKALLPMLRDFTKIKTSETKCESKNIRSSKIKAIRNRKTTVVLSKNDIKSSIICSFKTMRF